MQLDQLKRREFITLLGGAAAAWPIAARAQQPTVQLTALMDQCPNSVEGDMRALNEGSGFDPNRTGVILLENRSTQP